MDGRGQGRMAGTSTDVYELNGLIRGRHIYKTVWTPLINETLQVWKIPTNAHIKRYYINSMLIFLKTSLRHQLN